MMRFSSRPFLSACWLLLVLGLVAVSQSTQAAEHYASVYKISGEVLATDPLREQTRQLSRGDVVYVGEQIQASPTGEAVLRTDDAGVIAVRPNTTFVMEKFRARGDANDQFGLHILVGTLRLITGWVGIFNKPRHRISTPSASIGMRGTDHEPYVLSPEWALKVDQPAGTYDKVNKGGTYLEVAGTQIDIDPGRVGFAPVPPTVRTRALMTALLPILLDRVPGFFVPGAFDAELEALASNDLANALKTLKLPASTPPTGSPATGTPAPALASAAASAQPPAPASSAPPGCVPQNIATQWLTELDNAIAARDAAAFVAKFVPEAEVRARVIGANKQITELHFSRDELASSTFAALAQLTQFSSRRIAITGKLAQASSAAACYRLEVESVVIENGMRDAGAYRIESLETFTLVLRNGQWLATQAVTTQR